MLPVRLSVPLFVRKFAASALRVLCCKIDLRGGDYRMRKRYVNLKTILSRSKTILSGDNGDVIKPKESEEPFWLELGRAKRSAACLAAN